MAEVGKPDIHPSHGKSEPHMPTPTHPGTQRVSISTSAEHEKGEFKESEKKFPWDIVGDKQSLNLSLGFTTILVGKNINVGMGIINKVITKNLTSGAANINKAIVFDKVTITIGKIDELFCTSLTIVDNTFGCIGRKMVLTENELNSMAIKEAGSELGMLSPPTALNWNNFSPLQRVTLSREYKIAARKVELLTAFVQSVIAKDLDVAASYVNKAFAFDSVSLNIGVIEILFCTAHTTTTVGMGTIRNKLVLSHEELARMAMQEYYNMP